MRKAFEELTSAELLQLRKEIILNSILVYDYTNSFGFNSWDICSFFDGYVSYLEELAEDKDLIQKIQKICKGRC